MKYSYWLNVPTVFADCSANIMPFVECYTIFYGVAGKCENCFARECCLKLNAKEGVVLNNVEATNDKTDKD